jgi:restriction system protein
MNTFVFFIVALPFFIVVSNGGGWVAGLVLEGICLAIAAAVWQSSVNAANRRAAEEQVRLAEAERQRHRAAVEAQKRRDLEYVKSGMAAVDLMPGVEFEKYIAARLRQNGWRVLMTPVTGDYGVDLIAKKGDQRIAVQCKRYSKPIGISAVQQVVSGAMHHDCTGSLVVSNQEFTKAAKQLAQTHNCRLVGRSELPQWIL